MKVLVATRSDHKLAEIREILAGLRSVELVGLVELGIEPTAEEDDLEPYDTFEENARSKAEYFRARSGLPVLADDSGLAVDALGGAPGVRSKRFAPGEQVGAARDEANNRYLLERLTAVPDPDRTARYVCVVAWIGPSGKHHSVRGEVEGRIARAPSGSGGFGYDPLFHVPDLGRTFGEATEAEKHALSHRGRAFRRIAPILESAAGFGR